MTLITDGFQRRAKLTIPAAQVGSGGVSNYSVVLTESCIGSGHSFWGEVQANGGDLRASTDATGNTRLALDIIHLDTTAKTCEINVGQVALSAVSVNEFYLWWKHGTTQSQPAVGSSFGQYATYESANVARWDMSLTGGAVNDRTSNANHGTRQGTGGANNLPQEVAGKVGEALSFDGTDDRIGVTSSASVNLTGNFSLSAWVYLVSLVSTRVIIERGAYGSADEYGLVLSGSAGNGMVFQANNSFFYSLSTFPTGRWVYVNGVLSGSTGIYYQDGVAIKSGAISAPASGSDNLSIGSRNGTSFFHNGHLDDVRIYDRALSPAEITTDYNNTNSPGTFATLASADVLGGSNRRGGFRTGGNLTAGGILIGGRL